MAYDPSRISELPVSRLSATQYPGLPATSGQWPGNAPQTNTFDVSRARNQIYETLANMALGETSPFAEARNKALDAQIGALNQQAQAGQQQVAENMSARGLGRSGQYGSQVQDLERARLSTIASAQRQAGMDIANRQASDQMQAIGMFPQTTPEEQMRLQRQNNFRSQLVGPGGVTGYYSPTQPTFSPEELAQRDLENVLYNMNAVQPDYRLPTTSDYGPSASDVVDAGYKVGEALFGFPTLGAM